MEIKLKIRIYKIKYTIKLLIGNINLGFENLQTKYVVQL